MKTLQPGEIYTNLLKAGDVLQNNGEALIEVKKGQELITAVRQSGATIGPFNYDVMININAVDVVYLSTKSISISSSNKNGIRIVSAPVDLSLPSPYFASLGDNSAMHPCVIYNPDGFAGYKYWAAFTPYPSGNSDYENPCVAASNDLSTWETPAPNPITPKPTLGYLADTHIAFSSAGDEIYLIYRKRVGNIDSLMLKRTIDGVNWSNEIQIDSGIDDFTSPSLFYDKNIKKYRYFWHLINNTTNKLFTAETDSVFKIENKREIFIPTEFGRKWWHSWFGEYEGKIIGAIQDNDGTIGKKGDVFLAMSHDAENWSVDRITSGEALYRPALLLEKNKIFISETTGNTLKCDISFDKYQYINSIYRDIENPGYAILVDSFNRKDSSTPGISDTGQAWVVSAGSPGIKNNSFYNQTSGNNRAFVDAQISDYRIICKINSNSPETSQCFLWFRVVDTGNFIRFGFANNASKIQVYLSGSSVYTKIMRPLKFNMKNFVVEIIAIGDRVKIIVDGNTIFSELLNYHLSATKCGIQMSGDKSFVESFIVVK